MALRVSEILVKREDLPGYQDALSLTHALAVEQQNADSRGSRATSIYQPGFGLAACRKLAAQSQSQPELTQVSLPKFLCSMVMRSNFFASSIRPFSNTFTLW